MDLKTLFALAFALFALALAIGTAWHGIRFVRKDDIHDARIAMIMAAGMFIAGYIALILAFGVPA